MKKNNWYRNFGLADDKYIEEARPNNIIKSTKKRVILAFVATCACIAIVVCNLWLFIPFNINPPSVSNYEGSEYYEVIQKLNIVTFEKPKYKNNADKLWNVLKKAVNSFIGGAIKGDAGGDAVPDVPEYGANIGDNGNYQEITDNQVVGVIEADKIKRSDTHIYYLDVHTLRIFSINKENSVEVGSYELYGGLNNYEWEFYLSSDCKTVIVVTQYYERLNTVSNHYVKLLALDVSNPANITKKEEFSITGNYHSSRMTNGSILLMTDFVINKQALDFDDESTFIPQINEGNGFYSIPASEIIAPDNLNDMRYTIVLKLDESTLDLEGTAAYLSYSNDVYVSENHVFLTHVFADKKQNDDGSYTRNSMTEIACLTYAGETFEEKGKVTIRGYVKDQWSMDEYEGVLRVVTTTNATKITNYAHQDDMISPSILQTATGISNASLYCIDLTTFETIASVIDFAPPREEVQSVRFDKNIAYVCTSIELSDPVFFFDLSNLSNITYKDTGTIDGYSTSLINLGNGYLLGIGVGDRWGSFKVEVYEESENGVRSVSAYELSGTEYSTEYKSYYIDRQNQFVGMGLRDYLGTRYILLHFDGYRIVEIVNESLSGAIDNMRGVYIDGYMYMFGFNDFKVKKVL
ncbi:MAG: beta-propeller domain-containing protein [Clostridia bacterium]|nr:beta-propeller domain-containing protein [Clostridia bacterium]